MEIEFVPYNESLELKELGFDDPCFCYYNTSWNKQDELLFPQYADEFENWNNTQHLCSSPLFQQAFRWFREKCGLDYSVAKSRSSLGFEWYVYDEYQDNWDSLTNEYSYEAAELACLRKMIKIVKKEKQSTEN